MAKEAKKAKKAAEGSPAAKAEAAASYKYGVDYVAEQTGRKASSVRVAFRKHGIEKAEGGVYGWNSKSDVEAVIAEAFPAKVEKSKKASKTEKPAPKAAKKAKKASKADEGDDAEA